MQAADAHSTCQSYQWCSNLPLEHLMGVYPEYPEGSSKYDLSRQVSACEDASNCCSLSGLDTLSLTLRRIGCLHFPAGGSWRRPWILCGNDYHIFNPWSWTTQEASNWMLSWRRKGSELTVDSQHLPVDLLVLMSRRCWTAQISSCTRPWLPEWFEEYPRIYIYDESSLRCLQCLDLQKTGTWSFLTKHGFVSSAVWFSTATVAKPCFQPFIVDIACVALSFIKAFFTSSVLRARIASNISHAVSCKQHCQVAHPKTIMHIMPLDSRMLLQCQENQFGQILHHMAVTHSVRHHMRIKLDQTFKKDMPQSCGLATHWIMNGIVDEHVLKVFESLQINTSTDAR